MLRVPELGTGDVGAAGDLNQLPDCIDWSCRKYWLIRLRFVMLL